MATTKPCSTCNKDAGQMFCTGCDGYFCWKDFKSHHEGMFAEMDNLVEKRNSLQEEINQMGQTNEQQNPLVREIEQWRDVTIERVKQIAANVCRQAIELLNSKRTKISEEVRDFSKELVHLKETENYVEKDLTRLSASIKRFKQDLSQSTQSPTIKLRTERSDGINWQDLIYLEGQRPQTAVGKCVA